MSNTQGEADKTFSTDDYCYICARRLGEEECDVEHVVPRSFFDPRSRSDLIKLPSHRGCNSSFSQDDEWARLHFTLLAAQHSADAKKLWEGRVLRGLHRPESAGFKRSILGSLQDVEVQTEGGVVLGDATVIMQDAKRTERFIHRVVRGLYSHRTKRVLPATWPVSCDWMPSENMRALEQNFEMNFFGHGGGAFIWGSKHWEDDDREAIYGLLFFNCIHFWGFTGDMLHSKMPWNRS